MLATIEEKNDGYDGFSSYDREVAPVKSGRSKAVKAGLVLVFIILSYFVISHSVSKEKITSLSDPISYLSHILGDESYNYVHNYERDNEKDTKETTTDNKTTDKTTDKTTEKATDKTTEKTTSTKSTEKASKTTSTEAKTTSSKSSEKSTPTTTTDSTTSTDSTETTTEHKSVPIYNQPGIRFVFVLFGFILLNMFAICIHHVYLKATTSTKSYRNVNQNISPF
ncbi:uncharacterized protein RJT20DRAFT_124233 [Scheffersomyces xylosifermentans]|uniref:uncharacterized protein n=1 Tax=Scheffersomyces xylosifermentans TaxID=1304137 RepID=UPI00315DC376